MAPDGIPASPSPEIVYCQTPDTATKIRHAVLGLQFLSQRLKRGKQIQPADIDRIIGDLRA